MLISITLDTPMALQAHTAVGFNLSEVYNQWFFMINILWIFQQFSQTFKNVDFINLDLWLAFMFSEKYRGVRFNSPPPSPVEPIFGLNKGGGI